MEAPCPWAATTKSRQQGQAALVSRVARQYPDQSHPCQDLYNSSRPSSSSPRPWPTRRRRAWVRGNTSRSSASTWSSTVPSRTWPSRWVTHWCFTPCHLGPVSWRPTTVKWRQFSQSNRHSTIGTRQTEYHEALPLSVNMQSQLTSSFTDDGNASGTRFVECGWWNDGWSVKTVVLDGHWLHDTGPCYDYLEVLVLQGSPPSLVLSPTLQCMA